MTTIGSPAAAAHAVPHEVPPPSEPDDKESAMRSPDHTPEADAKVEAVR
jgi:hypothetical protein